MANTEDINAMIELATNAITDGVQYEPRVYYCPFNFDGTLDQVDSPSDAFRNGEKWPIRITHILACQRPIGTGAEDEGVAYEGGDERLIQRTTGRIRTQDSDYMNGMVGGIPWPLWHNKLSAGPEVSAQSTGVWRFDRPVIMGQRDTFEVRCQLEEDAPEVPGGEGELDIIQASVTFSGFGMFSKRPYFYGGTCNLQTSSTEVSIAPDAYRNEGAEPIVITTMTMMVTGGIQQLNPVGDIRQLKLRVRQVGNSTNQWWTHGPKTAPSFQLDHCPATAMSPTIGRAQIHVLPGDETARPQDKGWLWNPGESVSATMWQTGQLSNESTILAFLGYAIIT